MYAPNGAKRFPRVCCQEKVSPISTTWLPGKPFPKKGFAGKVVSGGKKVSPVRGSKKGFPGTPGKPLPGKPFHSSTGETFLQHRRGNLFTGETFSPPYRGNLSENAEKVSPVKRFPRRPKVGHYRGNLCQRFPRYWAVPGKPLPKVSPVKVSPSLGSKKVSPSMGSKGFPVSAIKGFAGKRFPR